MKYIFLFKMPHCCVPYCQTSIKQSRLHHISFHEFPSNSELRLQWINTIRRLDFTPNDWSSVCSLHFTASDYVEGLKIRRLKPKAVPSVFPFYPAYLQAAAAKKKARPPPKVRQPPPIKSRKSLQKQDVGSADIQPTVAEPMLLCPEPTPPSIDPGEPDFSELPSTSQTNTETVQPSCCNTLINSPTTLQKKRGRPCLSLQALKRDIRLLRKKVLHLQRRVQAQNSKIAALQQEPKGIEATINLKDIAIDAEHGCTKAIFLIDQLKAYDAKKARWSEDTVGHCLLWEMNSPKGYEFVKKSNLLSLPSRSTLNKYTGIISAEADSDITSLANQELDNAEMSCETAAVTSSSLTQLLDIVCTT